MPGGSAIECGNYENLSLAEGKKECAKYLAILEESEITFSYEV